ncbi:MAG: hypothetical protein COU82_01870 [Candidatus Portnoybacteria bacterium CG10_big_fil_rev_8_21_14_0_10_38_18]|uniref:DNA polymerase III subunit delta n=1 Tax=Candidatus Portnoybacteria bacterium CG10_big_fil_rev_8_21_14_0_10_38_18 TaxID=1974813 RepID=A0A2M8KC37_9BACT|nr:MAG: hypothetical protein COU82_01870 [Candidatus Portnoybacteria bacterium CG10_big_fil_rev_8_21_14_0_10_38_18]
MTVGKNHVILDFFKKAIERQKLAHGYLFWGGDIEEMKETAFGLAEYLKTNPFDILYIIPEENKKEISIDQIRKARRHLSLSSYNSAYKFAIIDKAETMNSEASNALLKTLEEPMGNTILILITSKPELLPKTILSRLQDVRFRPVPLNQIYKDFLNKEYINLLQKSLNDVFKFIEQISKDEIDAMPLLDCWLFFFRERLLTQTKSQPKSGSPDNFLKIIKEIQKTKDLISSTNINQRLALENLVLQII